MGVSSCTRPMGREKLQAVILGGLVTCGELTENSSAFAVSLKVSVSTDTPALEEYKHLASVQSLLITPETG